MTAKRIFFLTFSLILFSAILPKASWGESLGPAMLLGGGGTNSNASPTIETDEFTGAAAYSLAIPTPPGRGGINPSLVLTYNSYRRNLNSWVGLGWELDIGSIIRIPEPINNDFYSGMIDYSAVPNRVEVRLGGQAEELILTTPNVNAADYGIIKGPNERVDLYLAKINSSDTYFLHRYIFDGSGYEDDLGWVAIDKSGLRYYFGQADESQVKVLSDDSTFDTKKIQRWLLNRIEDPNGNTLTVLYSGLDRLPLAITYRDIVIRFLTKSHAYPYFPVFREEMIAKDQLGDVLDAIEIDRGGYRLQKFELSYEMAPLRGAHLLKKVEQFGSVDTESMPPVNFFYNEEGNLRFSEKPFGRSAMWGGKDGLIDESTTFADMNGDGLVDQILANDDGSFTVRFNNGNDFVYVSGKSDWSDPFECDSYTGDDPTCKGKLNDSRKGNQWLYLMDMNGDALPDRVGRVYVSGHGSDDETANLRIAFNNGHGWDPDSVEWRDPYKGKWAGTSDNEKGFIDMNGDGLIDRVVGDRGNQGFRVYYNTGAGFKRTSVFWKDPIAVHDPDLSPVGRLYQVEDEKTYAFIRDMNGDGLPDRVLRVTILDSDGNELGVGFEIDLNTNGRGWAQPKPAPDNGAIRDGIDNLGFIDPVSDTDLRGYLDKKADWIDVNGDGLLDRVEGDPDAGTFRIYFYQGATWTDYLMNLSPAVTLDDPAPAESGEGPARGYITNRTDDGDNPKQFAFFQDFNGDSLPDRLVWHRNNPVNANYIFYPLRQSEILFSDSPSWWRDPFVNQPIGALKEVNDGRGRRMAIEYHPSTWPREEGISNHRFLPFNMNLVHKVYTADHTLLPGSPLSDLPESTRHPGMRWTKYLFKGGNLFVRRAVKAADDLTDETLSRNYYSRFNGFQEVRKSTIQGPGETWAPYETISRYHQVMGDVDPWNGDPAGVFDANGYRHFALSGKPYLQAVEEGVRTVVRQEFVWFINEMAGSNFDCSGLCYPRLEQQTKSVWEAGSEISRISRVEYEYDGYGNITLERNLDGSGNLLLAKETNYYPAASFDPTLQIRDRPQMQKKRDDTQVYRWKEFAYDSRGNPTQEKFYADAGGSSYLSVDRQFYDNGNLKQITDLDGVVKKIGYDADGIFPISETVTTDTGTDLVTTREFDPMTGEASFERNPQGVGKRVIFDSFGRRVEEDLVNTAGIPIQTRIYAYSYLNYNVEGWENVTLLKTLIWEPQPDDWSGFTVMTPMEIQYSDASGQVLQKCLLSERGNYRLVQSRLRNGGREELQTEPVFSDTCDFLPILSPSARIVRREKDLEGRVVRVDPPPGDAASPVDSITASYQNDASGNLVKTTTNPRGQTRVEYFDALERLVEVSDPLGSAVQYTYNPVGDLLEVRSGAELLTHIDYDLLGRKYRMVDADMGEWQYLYDSFGRLWKQIDAKNQTIEHQYDGLGRIKQKDIYQAGGSLERREKYRYDEGDTGYDVLPGELFEVEEFDGVGTSVRRTRYGYEELLRTTGKISRFIPALGEFHQKLRHDFRGRIELAEYPTGHRLFHRYTWNGALKSISTDCCAPDFSYSYYSIDPSNGFDAYGSLIKEDYGNGIATEYEYYPSSHRLKGKRTYRGSDVYSQRTFEHDENSNIKKIGDPLDSRGSNALEIVFYDSLDRLTSYHPKGSVFWKHLEYDNKGNIHKNDASYGSDLYEYTSSRPHAVTKIGSKNFDYDANGNMISDPDRQMVYSARNQLSRVTMSNGAVVDHDYDYTGARVSKKATQKDLYHRTQEATTYYLGDALEIRGDKVILHVSAGQRKVASRTLGTISDAIGSGGGTLIDRGIDPVLNQTLVMPYLFLLAGLFLIASLRPVSIKLPQWAYVTRAPPLRKIYFFWRSYCQTLQETLFLYPQRAVVKSFLVFLTLLSIIQPPALLFAGDTGTPKTAPSDWDFFVYNHDDHLGSSHILTEGKENGRHAGVVYKKGDLLQRIEYTPFGQEKFVLNPNLKFDPSYTGQLYDMETGLYYYKSRYYNPVLGRFIQPDTVVPDAKDRQAYNRYTYVNNNPLKYIDPSGHFWFGFFIAIAIGALVGAVTSAIFGGNPLLGALQGMIAAAAFFSAGELIESLHITSLLAKVGIHAAAGAIAGALNNTVTGGGLGDIGRGAAIGGLSGGLSKYAGKFLKDANFLVELLGRSSVGAATGAVAAAISGGDILKGLGYGAGYAAASFVFNDTLHRGAEYLENKRQQQMLKQLEVDQRFQKDPVANRYQDIKAPMQTSLGVVSSAAFAAGWLTGNPILIIGGGVGLTFLGIDLTLDFYSNLSQGNFSEAASNIGDIMTTIPGTGVDQP